MVHWFEKDFNNKDWARDPWYKFYIEKKIIVERVFNMVGLLLPADGSKDKKLDIKALAEIEIGN